MLKSLRRRARRPYEPILFTCVLPIADSSSHDN
jgi:hypothetical protein